MALRKSPRGMSESGFNRWLRRERERCGWDWTLDLTGVRTAAGFARLLRSHFDERVRLEALADFTLSATVGPRFWNQLLDILGGHFGRLTVRVVGWGGFQERLPLIAGRLRETLQLVRWESEGAVRVSFDAPPAVRFRTFIGYLFLPPACGLTMPGVLKALRGHRWRRPTGVRAKSWKGVELDDRNAAERVRRLTAAGAEVILGSRKLMLALNDDPAQVAALRNAMTEIGWHDADELRPCRAVLEVWSYDADVKGTYSKRRAEVVECLRAAFPDMLVEDDDALGG